jgi:hypothetical protein
VLILLPLFLLSGTASLSRLFLFVFRQTLKSMLLLARKLNEKTMDQQVLRHFAKLQVS